MAADVVVTGIASAGFRFSNQSMSTYRSWPEDIPNSNDRHWLGDEMALFANAAVSGTNQSPNSNGYATVTVTVTWKCGTRSGTAATASFYVPKTGSSSGIQNNFPRWTIPLNIADQIPTSRIANITLTATFKCEGFTRVVTETLRVSHAPQMVPTVTDIIFTERNPSIPPGMPFLRGISRVTAEVVAVGSYGSTITSRSAWLGDIEIPTSGAGILVPETGSLAVTGRATDTRGRHAGTPALWAMPEGGQVPRPSTYYTKDIPTDPYEPPSPGEWSVERSTAAAVTSPTGTYLRVFPNASISSIRGNNTWQIRVYTRPKNAGTWILRNTINPTGTTYNTIFMIGGGAIYGTDTAWEVKLEIQDATATTIAVYTVASGAKILDARSDGRVAIGRIVEDDDYTATQLEGPASVYGDLIVYGDLAVLGDGLMIPLAGIATITNNQTGVTVNFRYGYFTSPPSVQAQAAVAGNVVQIENVSASKMILALYSAAGIRTQGVVHWLAWPAKN